MTTYIYTTWLQMRADLGSAAAVDIGRILTKGVCPRKAKTNKDGKKENQQRSFERLFSVST